MAFVSRGQPPSPPSIKPAAARASATAANLQPTRPYLPVAMTKKERLAGLRELGRGTFAKVYLEKGVALKAIKLKRPRKPSQTTPRSNIEKARLKLKRMQAELTKVERECKCLLTLASKGPHPNIIRLLLGPGGEEYELVGTTAILRLEFVGGGTLDRLMRHSPLPLLPHLYLMRQLADGLRHLHHCGWVHLDLKPQNLMVTPCRCRLKIGDFGCARLASSLLTSVVGTRDYLSPQAKLVSLATDPKSSYDLRATDLYACGVVDLQARLGMDAVEQLRASATGPIVDYARLAGPMLLPMEWQQDAIILRLLAYNEKDRGTAEEFFNSCKAAFRGPHPHTCCDTQDGLIRLLDHPDRDQDSRLGSPRVLRTLSTTFNQPWGSQGISVVPNVTRAVQSPIDHRWYQ